MTRTVVTFMKVKGKVLYGQEPHRAEFTTTGQFLVAVDPSQLRTMASETVDRIDYPLPSERPLHNANASHKSVCLCRELKSVPTTLEAKRFAYASTQDMSIKKIVVIESS